MQKEDVGLKEPTAGDRGRHPGDTPCREQPAKVNKAQLRAGPCRRGERRASPALTPRPGCPLGASEAGLKGTAQIRAPQQVV